MGPTIWYRTYPFCYNVIVFLRHVAQIEMNTETLKSSCEIHNAENVT